MTNSNMETCASNFICFVQCNYEIPHCIENPRKYITYIVISFYFNFHTVLPTFGFAVFC